MAVRRRAVAGGDPLLEDAELDGAVERGGAHAGFHAGPPLFRRRVAGIDDLHGCAPLVGWAKARSDVPTIVIPGSMVGTPPAAFAPGRFAHPHMGTCESRPRIDPDQVWHDGRAARGAMR